MFRVWFVLPTAAFAVAFAVQARAQTPDHFVSGSTVLVQSPVAGDLIVAGRGIEVNAAVGGDAALAGGEVRVAGRVGQDLYAAGGKLVVTGSVSQNARIAGGQVTIGPDAMLQGNLSAAGGEVSLEGPVAGSVRAVGGRVYLNSPVGGDVQIHSGKVELGPSARIAGKLRYASDEELRRAPAAQVQGGIERISSPSGWPIPATVERQAGRRGSWIWTFGLMLVAAVLVAVLPGFYSRVATTLQGHPGKSLLIGFVALIGTPVAVLALLITLIGIPLALLATMLYFIFLLVGYVSTSVALGAWALQHLKPGETGKTTWRIGASVIAVLAVGLVGRIPWVGPLVVVLVLLAGVGALVLQWRPLPLPAVTR